MQHQVTKSRCAFLKHAARVAAVLLFVSSSEASAAETTRPNLIFIIADQHSADMMSCAGNKYVQTPSMDRLARHGVRFTRAYVTHPLCIPSRASFMTGKMPTQCRGDVQSHTSLGMTMKQAGYDTGYFGKWHIQPRQTENNLSWHGFDTINTRGIDTEKARLSVDFIKRKRDKPFFMITSLLNPHDICQWARIHSGVNDEMKNGDIGPAPAPSKCPPLPANFDPPLDEPEVVRQRLVHDKRARTSVHPTSDWTESDWRQYRWAYCRLIELVDVQIGKLLDALQETGQLENTLIIYSSDHGDGNASHRWNQKVVLYEEAIRLPMIVSWKGHTRPGVTDGSLVSMNLDLLPTFCEFAGVELKEELSGKSLRQLVMADTKSDPAKQLHPFVVTETRLFDDVQGRALMTGRLKYIVYSTGKRPEQLFDLESDPGEMNSLVNDPAYQAELRRHRQLLQKWTDSIGDSFSLAHVK
ncbi:MAG: sulfatase-like hydrolase/transferase [Planctomycetes bacterium]|nr:sulfatase-like hydrolase/transferase [Planctomycetota bacterium]